MYFWRIEELKSKMAARPLTEREALPYLVVYVGLTALVTCLAVPDINIWDMIETGLGVLICVLGTIYAYHCNGADKGEHFLQRYFAIGWVVSLRVIAGLFLAYCTYLVICELAGISNGDATTWQDTLFIIGMEIFLYWRTGHHIAQLAQRTKD